MDGSSCKLHVGCHPISGFDNLHYRFRNIISPLFFNDLVTKLYRAHEEEVGESSLLGMFEDHKTI